VDAFGDVDLSILGDPTRRAIFELLARHPCSVGELAEQLPITRQAGADRSTHHAPIAAHR
jgi:predicted transcriptional regulator